METILAAAVTGLLGLFAVTAAGLIGLFAGVHLERERSQEWARKEGWAYKRQTYEETFNLLGELAWWLVWEEGDKNAPANQVEEIDKRSQKLFGLLFRMQVFLNEEARKAVDGYQDKLAAVQVIHNDRLRDEVIELGEKLTTAARTDLDFSSS